MEREVRGEVFREYFSRNDRLGRRVDRSVGWLVWEDNEEGEEKSVEKRLGALRSCILSFPLLPHRCRRSVQARNVACFDFA